MHLFIHLCHGKIKKVNHKLEKWISHLFGRQRPRWFVWLFTEMCMVHVGSHRADSACAQLVLMLVSKPRVHIFTHKALHWLHHVLKVLGVGCWVALQVYLNLQKKKGWICKRKCRKGQAHMETYNTVSKHTKSRVREATVAYFTITAELQNLLTLTFPELSSSSFLSSKSKATVILCCLCSSHRVGLKLSLSDW